MKILCLILLLANIILFVLGNWFAADTAGPPREEINAEKIKLLDPKELPVPTQPSQNN